MRSIVTILALSFYTSAFAVENCRFLSGDAYTGKITEESRELSFNNCPARVVVNDKYVANLSLLKLEDGTPVCGYSRKNVAFICDK